MRDIESNDWRTREPILIEKRPRSKEWLLFSFFVLVNACSLWGQAKQWDAYMERGKLFLELSVESLGKHMLLVRHGMGTMHVKWSRHGPDLLLESGPVRSESGVIIPQGATTTTILERFPIERENSNPDRLVMDISKLFLTTRLFWRKQDTDNVVVDKSLIDGHYIVENELMVRARRTIMDKKEERTRAIDFSLVFLPEPMRPRLFDHRMGYHAEDIWERSLTGRGAISRWRLEKDVETGEPIEPITFYLDPRIPEKWKSYIRAGIMEWLPSFENAGFKNAVEIREVDNSAWEWPGRSVSRSMILWETGKGVRGREYQKGATVDKVVDLRSGEILKADIIIGSFQSLFEDYFIRCAPLDPRARQSPVPDGLMGELLQYVVAHEAGHAFGIKDAHFGGYAYPFERMRDSNWLKKMGHTPSVMSYARHNYIVQPEDRIPPSLLIQKVGPSDMYHITWGYREFVGTQSPEDEISYLEALVRQQDSIPWYRHNRMEFEVIGPGSTNEVVDNDNPIESTLWGLRNLESVFGYLADPVKLGMDDEDVKRRYALAMELWYHQMQHLLSLVGGYSIQYRKDSTTGAIYMPVPRKVQEGALALFVQQAFDPPKWLAYPKCLEGMQHSTHPNLLEQYQLDLIRELWSPQRMRRLEKMEENPMYVGLTEAMLSQVRAGLWPGNRRLQYAYIQLLTYAVSENKDNSKNEYYTYSEPSKNLLVMELVDMGALMTKRVKNRSERKEKGHLLRSMALIQTILGKYRG